MCVDVSHLVLEAFRDPNDKIVDKRFDSAECGNVFASAMVQFDGDDVSGWVGEADGQVGHILDELACDT